MLQQIVVGRLNTDTSSQMVSFISALTLKILIVHVITELINKN